MSENQVGANRRTVQQIRDIRLSERYPTDDELVLLGEIRRLEGFLQSIEEGLATDGGHYWTQKNIDAWKGER